MKVFTKEELKLKLELHLKWLKNEVGGERVNLRSADLSYADLSSANLRYADLSYANLRSANLRSADLDFSAYPLWCGTKDVKLDLKIIRQLCAHICVVDNDTKEFAEIKEKLMVHALKSHRATDLGLK